MIGIAETILPGLSSVIDIHYQMESISVCLLLLFKMETGLSTLRESYHKRVKKDIREKETLKNRAELMDRISQMNLSNPDNQDAPIDAKLVESISVEEVCSLIRSTDASAYNKLMRVFAVKNQEIVSVQPLRVGTLRVILAIMKYSLFQPKLITQ